MTTIHFLGAGSVETEREWDGCNLVDYDGHLWRVANAVNRLDRVDVYAEGGGENMSLDIYLEGEEREVQCVCSRCEHTHTSRTRECLFSTNIPHNRIPMAQAAGIYEACWRPEELGITKAAELIPYLSAGIEQLESNPEGFRKLNTPDGYPYYKLFLVRLREYLSACHEHPDANVRASR